MDPDDQYRIPTESFGEKIILERAKHDAIYKQYPDGADGKKEAHHKGQERHLDIVECDADEHGKLVLAFIDAEGIATRDVVFRHFHILVAQHTSYETIVLCSGESREDGAGNKYEERVQQLPVVFSYHEGQFRAPEIQEPRFFLFFVAEDGEIGLRGQTVKVTGNITRRIKSARITKIVDEIGEPVCRFIGVIGRFMLVFFPLVDIFPDEKSFSHR